MDFKSLMTIDNLKEVICLILPIMTTYFITRYSINRPNKLIIKEKQFLNVYLPLYKAICLYPDCELSRKQLLRYNAKLQSILNDNYALVFPQLHNLAYIFRDSLHSDTSDSVSILNKIRYQISKDYELLKHDLGYPTQNILSTLIRMNAKDKVNFISGKIYALSLLSMLSCLFLYVIDKIFSTSIVAITLPISMFVLFISGFIYTLSSDSSYVNNTK